MCVSALTLWYRYLSADHFEWWLCWRYHNVTILSEWIIALFLWYSCLSFWTCWDMLLFFKFDTVVSISFSLYVWVMFWRCGIVVFLSERFGHRVLFCFDDVVLLSFFPNGLLYGCCSALTLWYRDISLHTFELWRCSSVLSFISEMFLPGFCIPVFADLLPALFGKPICNFAFVLSLLVDLVAVSVTFCSKTRVKQSLCGEMYTVIKSTTLNVHMQTTQTPRLENKQMYLRICLVCLWEMCLFLFWY